MMGIEILKPKTVVDVSTLLTSTSIRGRNLLQKNPYFSIAPSSDLQRQTVLINNVSSKLQMGKCQNSALELQRNCNNSPSTTTAREAALIIFQEKCVGESKNPRRQQYTREEDYFVTNQPTGSCCCCCCKKIIT
jgi:hypothetical protein